MEVHHEMRGMSQKPHSDAQWTALKSKEPCGVKDRDLTSRVMGKNHHNGVSWRRQRMVWGAECIMESL